MTKHKPSLQDLQKISPDNVAAKHAAATTPGDIANVSTAVVSEMRAFNSGEHDAAVQAAAVVRNEHLTLMGRMDGYRERVTQMKSSLSQYSNQLKGIRLPATRVNIGGREIEIAAEIKQYARDLQQAKYIEVANVILGNERLEKIYGFCKKGNQNTIPALWLNQHVAVETQMDYVYQLRKSPENKELIDELNQNFGNSEEFKQLTNGYLADILGPDLFHKINVIADGNNTLPFVAFVILVDRIISNYEGRSTPITQQSIWDGVIKKKEEKARPELTAEVALGR